MPRPNDRRTRFATIIWPDTARLSFDRNGLLLADQRSGAALRLGDYLEGTGGRLPPGVPHSIGDDILTESFPIECARRRGYDGWIGIVNAGFRKGRPPALKLASILRRRQHSMSGSGDVAHRHEDGVVRVDGVCRVRVAAPERCCW